MTGGLSRRVGHSIATWRRAIVRTGNVERLRDPRPPGNHRWGWESQQCIMDRVVAGGRMKQSPGHLVALALPALIWTGFAYADNAGVEQLRTILAEEHPGVSVDTVRPTPIDDFFEITSGGNIFYMSGDGRFVLRGELLDLAENRNLTAERKGGLSHDLVESLGEETMVVYEPRSGPSRHTITVFTDTTCGFCQRLHEELLPVIDQERIKLRYVMFPRAGVDAGSAETLRRIWCADDPQDAMTRAKRQQSVPARDNSCQPPVEAHFTMGQRIGVSGTPYLLLNDDGPVFAGYRPADELIRMLEQSASE